MKKIFLLAWALLVMGCGAPGSVTPPPPVISTDCIEGENMQTLPSKFAAENSKDSNTPSLLVDVQAGVLQSDQTTQANWQANTGESGVDYATTPGDVILAHSTCAWTQKASGASARFNHALAQYNGKIYVFSGWTGSLATDLWEYNIATNAWTQKTGPGHGRESATLAAYNGYLYRFGGVASGTWYNDLWRYDITGDTWSQLTPTGGPPAGRGQHVAIVHGDKMYIYGGGFSNTAGDVRNDTWEYNIAANTWTQKADGPSARRHPAAAVLGSAMYMSGGYSATPAKLNDFWEYNIAANTWTSKATGPSARFAHALVGSAGRLFLFGGGGAGSYLNDLWRYTVADDTWTQLSPTGGPPSGRYGPKGASYAGHMYIFGGATSDVNYLNDVWETPTGYAASGYIYTQDMDVTTAPAVNGEWTLEDTAPAGASVAYTAWASDTGAFAGEETSLGTIVDGGTISVLKRYYRVKADLATTDGEVTPALQRIKAAFYTFDSYADNGSLGYEPSVLDVSALTTMIDFFDKSTISQVTLTMGLTPAVSNWLSTAYPRNKVVKIKAGYVAPTWVRDDYIDYFTGQVEDWRVDEGKVSLIVRDYSKSWKTPVPAKWESAADNVTWTAQHPVDVMLDILRNYVNVRDSQLVTSSFSTVKTALSGWAVTRTITSNPVEAETLLQELRMLTSTYFIPQADGRITLKRYDATEAAVLSLTDDNFKDVAYEGNAAAMCNQYHTYFNSSSNGDNASDFTEFRAALDAASQTNWNELRLKDFKDKWTRTAQVAQVQDRETKIMARFANPPAIINGTIHRSHIAAEVGDMFSVTTVHAPAPITAAKYQLINKNLDYGSDTIKIKLLRA